MGLFDRLKRSKEPQAYYTTEMTAKDFLDAEIVVELPETLFLKELAVYSAISLVANAISQCEILVYENGKSVRNEDWYTLNIKANTNESASRFWHKVVEQMMSADSNDKGALVITNNGHLFCADRYNIREKRPFKAAGNLYDGVVVDELELQKTYTAKETMLFKLENTQANLMIAGMYSEISDAVAAALNKFKSSNTQRWKFKIDSREAGSEDFQRDWQTKLKAAVQKYVDGDAQIYVEYDGRTLEPVATSDVHTVSAEDNVKLINEIFELVSKAYHIPPGLMTTGNYNVSDLINQFLTFTVDPVADMISKTLTGAYYDSKQYAAGNYFRVDTSRIRHFDVFNMAPQVDKLISSGFASINEVRAAADWDPAGDPEDPENWLNKHILTKNYEKGGETENEGPEKI